MPQIKNRFNQPIGPPVDNWRSVPRPDQRPLVGVYCRLEALSASRHGADLFAAFERDDGRVWTYMPFGPLADQQDFIAWLSEAEAGTDPLFYAIVDQQSGQALGFASYLRIKPAVGVIEVGNIALSPALQRTAAATEAMFLMMQHAFDLGYRRYEWKCDALNAPSRRAAMRLGFGFDGLFEQALVYKGRNRDTAWYSVLDRDWSALKRRFQEWLSPENFDAEGNQINRLSCEKITNRNRD